MARVFDHIVLCVRDLDRAHDAFRDLGFTLTPRAVHPFGTMNHLVQLPGMNFLEIVAVNDEALFPPPGPPTRFNFAVHTREFLRHREGMSMLVFVGADAAADVAEFRAKRLHAYDAYAFGRDAKLPDGSMARVGFELAFVDDPGMPDIAFFTCRQTHPPELFWKDAYQRHANGATRFVEAVLSAPDPAAHASFLAALTNGAVVHGPGMLAVGPPTDRITVLTPARLAERFPELAGVDNTEPPRFRALAIEAADLGAVRNILEHRGVPHRVAPDAVIVPATAGHGLALAFRRGAAG